MIHKKSFCSKSVALQHGRENKSVDDTLLIKRKTFRRRYIVPFRPSPGLFKELQLVASQRIPKMSPVKFRCKIDDQSMLRPVVQRSKRSSCFNNLCSNGGNFSPIIT
mmetsp:Transcript_14745/g.20676  ORF Transcript_14745/g.20676 Transcript_14745/m.20676 type:complete len:107 (+) Transcript_14745:151-471(+)